MDSSVNSSPPRKPTSLLGTSIEMDEQEHQMCASVSQTAEEPVNISVKPTPPPKPGWIHSMSKVMVNEGHQEGKSKESVIKEHQQSKSKEMVNERRQEGKSIQLVIEENQPKESRISTIESGGQSMYNRSPSLRARSSSPFKYNTDATTTLNLTYTARGQKMKDEEVNQILWQTKKPYTSIAMSENELLTFPAFTQYESFKALSELYLSYNRISHVRPEHIPHTLKLFDISDNNLRHICSLLHCKKLRTLRLNNNILHNIDLDQFPEIIEVLDLSHNKLDRIGDFEHFKMLQILHLNDNNFNSNANFKMPSSLQVLNIHRSGLRTLSPVSHCTKLKELTINQNKINTIDGNCMPSSLEILDISDNELEKIDFLTQCIHLKELSASGNMLVQLSDGSIPQTLEVFNVNNSKLKDISSLKHCGKLRTLRLCGNFISQKYAQYIPRSVQVLDLSNNIIAELESLTHCRNLRELSLKGNKLCYKLKSDPLPSTIQIFDVRNNSLNSVGSMKKLSKLTELYIDGNNIQSIQGFPESIRIVGFCDNPLTRLHNDCFPNANVCYMLLQTLKESNILKDMRQPPPEVLTQSYEDVKKYFEVLGISTILENSVQKIVFLGMTEAGKTSLAKSLIQSKAVLTSRSDRTMVIKIRTWNVTENQVYLLYDQGGHEIYSVTMPLFVSNKCTVLIHHDISNNSNENIDQTILILQRTLQQQPENDIHFVITHIDTVNEFLKGLTEKFKSAVHSFLWKEIKMLELRSNTNASENVNFLLRCYKNLYSSAQFFQISNKTFEGIENLKFFLVEHLGKRVVDIPLYWAEFFKKINANDSTFLHWTEALSDFKEFYPKESRFQKIFKRKEVKKQMEGCLQYLHDCGLIMWQNDNVPLKGYIFHKLWFLVDTFKGIFNHELEKNLNYENNWPLQQIYNKAEFQAILKAYRSEGLLNEDVLMFLWGNYNFTKDDKKILLAVMDSFDMCYPVISDVENPQYFFPWFVHDRDVPMSINMPKPFIIEDNCVSFALECEFYNMIPVNVCERLCVKLQKYAVLNHYHGERIAWSTGLKVTLDRVECIVCRKNRTTITCCVRSIIDDLPIAWDRLTFLYEGLMSILSEWYGLLKSIHLVCAHCIFMCISNPCRWPASSVWSLEKSKIQRYVRCENEAGVDIPAGLILPLHSDAKDCDKRIACVSKYLSQWSDTPMKERIPREMRAHLRNHFTFFESCMFIDPVLSILEEQGVLSARHKIALSQTPQEDQIYYLMYKVILPASTQALDCFREALMMSEYNTNDSLVCLLPHVLQEFELPQEFLSKEEFALLKETFYQDFLELAPLDDLVKCLKDARTLHDCHYTDLRSKQTDKEKAMYLLHNVLLRGTHNIVVGFHRALGKCGHDDLAKLLPLREAV